MATSLVTTDDSNSISHYENFWIVDNSSYHSCNVNTSITDNKILFKCDKPLQLNFEQLVFQSHGMAVAFRKGKTYYFICKYLLFVLLKCDTLNFNCDVIVGVLVDLFSFEAHKGMFDVEGYAS